MLRIGVDGGATTTRAVLVDENLNVLGRGEAGSSNHYSVGLDRAVENIAWAVEAALEAASTAPDAVLGWGLGLAGACTGAEQSTLTNALAHLTRGKALVVDEDAAAAQAGAFAGEPGVVCVAGTGANCFGVNITGERARADGLGPLLGDRGSGYWIGEQTLRAACMANDGAGPQTALLDAVLSHFQAPSVDELVQLVYRPDFAKDRVASLVPPVIQCARDGDEVAFAILNMAGAELAATAFAVLKALYLNRVATYGGVISGDSPVRAAFEKSLQEKLPDVQVQDPLHDAAIGAALLVRSG